MRSLQWLLMALVLSACGGDGGGGAPDADAGAGEGDAPAPPKRVLGGPCASGADCVSGVCLVSAYGPPFCSRPCDTEQVSCPAGDDAAPSESLCVSFAKTPNPAAPGFVGDLETFCVRRCTDEDACVAANASWEVCDVPRWLGDPLYPNLGGVRVCQAPSFQGKDPVDPATCDWEKTIEPQHANLANMCRNYCTYLDTCKELQSEADLECCAWGCFNQMIIDTEVNDPWKDEVRCFLDSHGAYPPVGAQNFCNQPPIDCDRSPPIDPTPAAAR